MFSFGAIQCFVLQNLHGWDQIQVSLDMISGCLFQELLCQPGDGCIVSFFVHAGVFWWWYCVLFLAHVWVFRGQTELCVPLLKGCHGNQLTFLCLMVWVFWFFVLQWLKSEIGSTYHGWQPKVSFFHTCPSVFLSVICNNFKKAKLKIYMKQIILVFTCVMYV